MIDPIVSRRHFNHISLISLLAAAALPDGTAAAHQHATPHAATRRDVIRHELPGEPLRDISLIEVTSSNRFPTASSRQWRHGIRRFWYYRLEGRRRSRADVPCRRCLVGTSGCDPSGLAQCELDRAGDPARNLRRAQERDGGRFDETDLS
jgi:hypothetical protein